MNTRAEPPLKLYCWNRCGHSAIALLCLQAKGLRFERAHVDLLRLEQYSPSFLAVNAAGQVPVLVHGDSVITQTNAILEYLDETFPEPALMPHDALGRWRVRVWAKILNEDIAPSVSQLAWHRYTRSRLTGDQLAHLRRLVARISIPERREVWMSACAEEVDAAQVQFSERKLEVALARMEAELGHAQWLAGEQLSLADLQLYPLIAPVAKLLPEQLNAAATPQIARWMEQMSAQPCVQLALGTSAQDRDELLALAPGPEHIRWG
jgi:glutathione S-transferase